MKYMDDYQAGIDYAKKSGITIGRQEGEANGIAIGRREGMAQAAKSMLAEGLDPTLVARITKLPKKQLMALR